MSCIIPAAVLLFIILLALLPVGLEASYTDGEFSLTGRAGPVPIRLFPKAPLSAAERAAAREEKALLRRLPSPPVLGLLLENGARVLGRLLGSLSVRVLRVRFVAGGPDPYAAAMAYARAGVAMEGLDRLAAGKVADKALLAQVDFDGGKSVLDGRLAVRARLGRLLFVLACFGTGFLRGYFRYRKTTKTEG